MTHIKKFNESFREIKKERKLTKNFKLIGDSVYNIIVNTPELSYIIDLAKDTKGKSFDSDEHFDKNRIFYEKFNNALSESFPKIDFTSTEYLKSGPDFPIYGRTSLYGPSTDIVTMFDYIRDKIVKNIS